jgi:hypothetical protein
MGIIPQINIAKQVFGTATGQKIENAEDSVLDPLVAPLEKLAEDAVGAGIASFLKTQNEPTTVYGLLDYVDKLATSRINAMNISDTLKADFIAALNALEVDGEKALPNDTI